MANLNGVMMQFFHWYIPPDGSLWNEVQDRAPELAQKGVTALWLPPAYKGNSGGYDVGYSVYDMYDLGEFDQKGSVRTKYGTKDEYLTAIEAAHDHGMDVYADVVFNHRIGGDETEEFNATPFNESDRNIPIGEMRKIKSWTKFNFPGRDKKYSDFEWHWWHFTAVDFNDFDPEYKAVFLFEGKVFDDNVDSEKGSFDYLMGCDLDVNHPEVRQELKSWGEWYIDTTKIDGVRFDAVKHVRAGFFPQWLNHLREYSGKDIFAVGEYWSYEVEALHHFIDVTGGNVALFDAPLHLNFALASKAGNGYDMRTIFDGSLVQNEPTLAVTIVANHDTQPLQALESVVEPWFKPLAYALILLRRDGYPCIFYPDYFGAHYKDSGKDGQEYEIWMNSHQWLIDKFLEARQNYAFGDQYDYFDHANTVGWTRLGTKENQGAMAVVLSNGDAGSKWMEVGQANQTYFDLTEHISETITTNDEGWAEFRCEPGSVSVWVPQE